jgi:hypothetical protein
MKFSMAKLQVISAIQGKLQRAAATAFCQQGAAMTFLRQVSALS